MTPSRPGGKHLAKIAPSSALSNDITLMQGFCNAWWYRDRLKRYALATRPGPYVFDRGPRRPRTALWPSRQKKLKAGCPAVKMGCSCSPTPPYSTKKTGEATHAFVLCVEELRLSCCTIKCNQSSLNTNRRCGKPLLTLYRSNRSWMRW